MSDRPETPQPLSDDLALRAIVEGVEAEIGERFFSFDGARRIELFNDAAEKVFGCGTIFLDEIGDMSHLAEQDQETRHPAQRRGVVGCRTARCPPSVAELASGERATGAGEPEGTPEHRS